MINAHPGLYTDLYEYTAFEKFAETTPGKIILLVDTYDTLGSGVPNVIKLAKKLKELLHLKEEKTKEIKRCITNK